MVFSSEKYYKQKCLMHKVRNTYKLQVKRDISDAPQTVSAAGVRLATMPSIDRRPRAQVAVI